MKTLSKANHNTKYVIDHIEGSTSLKRRLLEMGFTKNTEIEIIGTTIFNDPIQIKIRGFIVALRLFEASHIIIKDII